MYDALLNAEYIYMNWIVFMNRSEKSNFITEWKLQWKILV